MKRKVKRRAERIAGLFLVILYLSIIYTAPVPALAEERSYETEVINNISVGDISIALCEYETDDDGAETEYRNPKRVLPGEIVSKTVRVTNLANPAWIRVKLTYLPADGMKDFPPSCIALADDYWIERGGYYYRTRPLESGEEADFIRGIRIPSFWGNEAAGKDFEIAITAEAVQEANFIPDFTAEDPWFGTLIETCVHTSRDIPVMTRYRGFSVSFEGGAEGLVRLGDDFFANFGTLMPGDEGSGVLTLKNAYASPIALYFRTEGLDEGPLANEAHLVIRDGDSVIYDGKLSGSRDEVKIADLDTDGEKELTYSIFIPPECGNSYAVTKAADKWIFRASLNEAEKSKKPASSGGGSHSGGGGSGSGGVVHGGPVQPVQNVNTAYNLAQTGEGNGVFMALAVMALSGLTLAAILLYCRHRMAKGGVR